MSKNETKLPEPVGKSGVIERTLVEKSKEPRKQTPRVLRTT